jgi:hypothetical protein
MRAMKPNNGRRKHVVLVGASVGGAWRIAGLGKRVGDERYGLEFVHGGSQFDKSEKIREVLSRGGKDEGKAAADAIILKECAAYFPGDLDRYRELMEGWIRECREGGVVPVPATVVPVTKLHAYKVFVGYPLLRGKNPLKYGCPFEQKRVKCIWEYNDWVRDYAQRESLVVLDLEAALRHSGKDRYLRGDLARVDGLHLKPEAYRLLDRILLPTLDLIKWGHIT